jgi:hypothetical protein
MRERQNMKMRLKRNMQDVKVWEKRGEGVRRKEGKII